MNRGYACNKPECLSVEPDRVNNPAHYQSIQGKEVWEMMVDVWGVPSFLLFCEMNAFKYRMRAGKKDGSSAHEDIRKALWYEDKARQLKTK